MNSFVTYLVVILALVVPALVLLPTLVWGLWFGAILVVKLLGLQEATGLGMRVMEDQIDESEDEKEEEEEDEDEEEEAEER